MTDARQLAGAARTLLFVPGIRPDRFERAVASGADLVVADLEDAVPAGDKATARLIVGEALRNGLVRCVRINAAGTPEFDGDVAAIAHIPCAVMLPKAADEAVLAALVKSLAPGSAVIALIETAVGVLDARGLASVPGVERLAFGSLDFATELGLAPDNEEALAPARSHLVLASAAAGITPPVDGVTVSVNDRDRIQAEAAHARALGFGGKLCIHPAQVGVVAAAFRPSPDEVAWAERIVSAADSSDGRAILVDGKMVDKPVVNRARLILQAARGE